MALEQAGLRRRPLTLEAVDGSRVRIDGRQLVCWCSNDYLGLAAHPRLARAAAQAAAEFGVGARASRLLAGTTRWHTRLEEALAGWFGAEDAIVFPSGYLANAGALTALLSRADAVYVDRLAHASLVEAACSSRAALRVFRHNDLEHLGRLLQAAAPARRRVIVTEGVFSMEGDRAPLAALADLAEARGAVVYVDDAHGAFVLGSSGRGSCEDAGVGLERVLYMGTLGKALGAQGGFLAGPATLIEYLRNAARPFIYTTALAPPSAAAAVEALRVLQEEPGHRDTLWRRAGALHEQLQRIGLRAGDTPSHIVPVIVGEARRALALAQRLWQQGMWAPAIRPPTVPRGTARLRLSVTALHTEEQIRQLVEGLRGQR